MTTRSPTFALLIGVLLGGIAVGSLPVGPAPALALAAAIGALILQATKGVR